MLPRLAASGSAIVWQHGGRDMARFDVDGARFLSDHLDGEIIVMDMLQGRLFLLEEGAAILWERVLSGQSRESIMAAIQSRYGGADYAAADGFLNRLLALGLVTENLSADGPSQKDEPISWPPVLGELRLTEYDDMTNIITMDPIHDVDPKRGWPFEGRD